VVAAEGWNNTEILTESHLDARQGQADFAVDHKGLNMVQVSNEA